MSFGRNQTVGAYVNDARGAFMGSLLQDLRFGIRPRPAWRRIAGISSPASGRLRNTARMTCVGGLLNHVVIPRVPRTRWLTCGRSESTAISRLSGTARYLAAYPLQTHSRAAGKVCSLVGRSQCPAFLAKTN